MIHAVAFMKVATFLGGYLKEGEEYQIKNASVRHANRLYANFEADYSLVLNQFCIKWVKKKEEKIASLKDVTIDLISSLVNNRTSEYFHYFEYLPLDILRIFFLEKFYNLSPFVQSKFYFSQK